jgi:uncharacterized protein (TIGR00106 family)
VSAKILIGYFRSGRGGTKASLVYSAAKAWLRLKAIQANACTDREAEMAVVEISVTPLGTAGSGVSQYVAACVDVVAKSGLSFQLTPMGTILEGELDAIFAVLRAMHEVPFAKGAARVSTLIKIDDRRDRDKHSMAGKVASVQAHRAGTSGNSP